MKFRKPSVSLGVALVALVVAMSGTAVAASLITSAQIKDGTILVKDLSPKARAYLKGQQGPKGDRGPVGAAGSARAYAYVDADGTVEAARSRNITVEADVNDPGVYCVNVEEIDPATVAPIVTVSDTPLSDGAAGSWSAFLTFDSTILAGEVTAGDCAVVPDFLVIVRNGDPGFVPQDFTISIP